MEGAENWVSMTQTGLAPSDLCWTLKPQGAGIIWLWDLQTAYTHGGCYAHELVSRTDMPDHITSCLNTLMA